MSELDKFVIQQKRDQIKNLEEVVDVRNATIASQAATIERLKEALKNLIRTPLGYASYQEATSLLAELEAK